MPYNTMNDRMLAVGTETHTYNMGKILKVRVLVARPSKDVNNIYGPEYLVKYIGDVSVCLDYGQNWNIIPGENFTCYHLNIEGAVKNLKSPLTCN